MKERDHHGQDELVREILGYLINHLDAKDVTEGILKWWLPEGQLKWGKEDVQKALDCLTSKGWLTEREAAPSKKIYGINKDQLEEMGTFLKGHHSRQE